MEMTLTSFRQVDLGGGGGDHVRANECLSSGEKNEPDDICMKLSLHTLKRQKLF